MPTRIEWAAETWNPIVGCSRVSPGCGDGTGGGCYAERMTHRLGSMPAQQEIYGGLTRMTPNGARWTGQVKLIPEKLEQPLRWQKPRRVFVCSMSDLFHESVPERIISAVFGVMASTPQHTYMVLTKRPRRMLGWFRWIDSERHDYAPSSGVTVSVVAAQHILEIGSDRLSAPRVPWALPNVWLGVSAENQQAADERIPLLFRCPATVHWVSVEPCLSRVDLRPHLDRLGGPDRLDWIVCGSESETDIDWMRDLRDQCVEAGVPFFLKQRHEDGKKISMPELDGRVWDGMP